MELYITICEVVTYVSLAMLSIFLVGYVTGADYYFKLSNDYESEIIVFFIFSSSWFIYFILFIGYLIDDNIGLKDTAYLTTGTCYMFVFAYAICMQVYRWIERAREYFWNKRGL